MPPDSSPEAERWRVAYHEAGHVVAAALLGGRVTGQTSIAPTRRWSGVTFVRSRNCTKTDRERADLLGPWCALPARLRRSVESEIVIHLAGPEAEWLRPALPTDAVHVAERRDERLARELVAVPALTADDRRLLARGDTAYETDEERRAESDDGRAWHHAYVLVGERGGLLVEMLRRDAQLIVRSLAGQRLLHPLAAALHEHTDLSAEAVRAMIRDHRRRAA